MKSVNLAKRVFDSEINALCLMRDSLDETFETIVGEILNCKGKIIVTGIGKSGHIARKIAATLSSLGSPAIFVHLAESLHGDLGMIQESDLVIAISYSGESDEITRFIPGIKTIGAKLIGITGNGFSTLAINSNLAQVLPKFSEACLFGLAPTSSTTTALVYGDALAVAASELKGFGKNDFKVFHPAGALGKNLTLRVFDCMRQADTITRLTEKSTLAEALKLQCETGWEILPVSSNNRILIGTISAGKIKNILTERLNIYENVIENYIERGPCFVNSDEMAVDALRMMKHNSLETVIAVKENIAVGILKREDILKQGVYI